MTTYNPDAYLDPRETLSLCVTGLNIHPQLTNVETSAAHLQKLINDFRVFWRGFRKSNRKIFIERALPEAYKRLRAKCYQGLDAFDLFHGFTENNIHEQAFSDDIQALIVMEHVIFNKPIQVAEVDDEIIEGDNIPF